MHEVLATQAKSLARELNDAIGPHIQLLKSIASALRLSCALSGTEDDELHKAFEAIMEKALAISLKLACSEGDYRFYWCSSGDAFDEELHDTGNEQHGRVINFTLYPGLQAQREDSTFATLVRAVVHTGARHDGLPGSSRSSGGVSTKRKRQES